MAQNNQEHNLYHIERGNQATSVKALLLPFVNEKINAAVSHMVAVYRSGDIRPDILIGKTGEVSVLMSILAELEVTQERGRQAMDKELK